MQVEFVGDTSQFGPTSPILGQRYRFELSSLTGSLRYAGVVTDYRDVLDVIAPGLSERQARLPLGNTELETTIINLIAGGLRDGEALRQQTGADATEFSTALTMLELSGVVRSLGANQWTIS